MALPKAELDAKLEEWRHLLVGKLVRVVKRDEPWEKRGPMVVKEVGVFGNDYRGPIFTISDGVDRWYIGGNRWDPEVYGEGVIHAQ